MFTRQYPDGLFIRPPRPEDGPLIYEYFVHPDVSRTTRANPAAEIRLTLDWIERQNGTQHRFLAIMDNQPVGSVGLHVSGQPRQPRMGSLGLMVHPDYWRRGIGRRLMQHILDLADHWLNLDRVALGVLAPNTPAIALYESLGFEVEGRERHSSIVAGQRVDEIKMARIRNPIDATWSGPLPTLESIVPVSITNQVEIRPVTGSDLEDLYELWLHPDVWSHDDSLPSLEYISARDHLTNSPPAQHRLAAVVGGKVVGLGTLYHRLRNPRRQHSADIHVVVHPAYRRQGIGTQLAEALHEIADDWLNLNRISGTHLAGDEAARALISKLGYHHNAISRKAIFGHGHYHDVVMVSRYNGLPLLTEYPLGQTVTPPLRKPLNGNVKIRPLHPDDIPALHQLFRHPLVANTTAQMPTFELKDAQKRLKPTHRGMYRLVADLHGQAIGVCTIFQADLKRRSHSAGLGMMLLPEYWGYGIGSQLLAAIIDIADNWLGLRRIDLEVTTDNPAGIALYRKFGFEHEGTIPYYLFGGGRWAHVQVMSRWK